MRETFKNKISEEIAFSHKRNIQTPQTEWFTNEMYEWINQILKKSNIWDIGVYNKKEFFRSFKKLKSKKINNSFFVWQALNLNFIK